MPGKPFGLDGTVELALNDEAYANEQTYKDYVEAPILEAGGKTPRFNGWQSYLIGMATFTNLTK